MMMRARGISYLYIPLPPELEMFSPAKRLIMITSAIALVAACASPTSPTTSRIAQPTAPTRIDIDSSMCRSGYNNAEARCN
jgi:hypothetical protein